MRTEDELYVEVHYRILYEDAFFLAVEKPAPLPVHPVGRFKEKNLLSLLKRDFTPIASGFRIVNRLDSETSGIVLVAKSAEAAGSLGLLFERREVYKEYEAIVFGIPEPGEGTVAVSLGSHLQNSQRIRMPDPEGQSARTDYRVLKRLEGKSFLQIVPYTGRTHQIRAHLAFLGHPVVGDKIYIDPQIFERYTREGWQEDMLPVVGAKRLLLHATKLRFEHPATGEPLSFFSRPPFLP